MKPGSWQRARKIFEEVLDLPEAQRAAHVEATCHGDSEMLELIEGMLAADRRADHLLDVPILKPDDVEATTRIDVPATSPGLVAGTVIGRYRVLRLLAEGGMGAVYLATRDDGSFARRVVLKLVRSGMESSHVLERLTTERRILAALDHPYISRLYDGGSTDDGRPYFVLEYIEGQPIDRYCRAHALSIDERLELFTKVCEAVQFAHQNLIIHRDLKPANILVTDDGTPKLLDFGIAKLLDPSTFPTTVLPTAPDWRAMTPEYASPEQMRGGPVTTASDVYALGVILYELLTGVRPYVVESRGIEAMMQAINTTEPRRASQAVTTAGDLDDGLDPKKIEHRLRGDLDDILRMTLEKDPDRRYGSVDQLAADLRRHLDGRPVLARPDSVFYRTSKWVRRHKLAVGAAAVIFVFALTFLITSWTQHVQILRQHDRAEEISAFLTDLFENPSPARRRGEAVTARELLDQGAREIEFRLHERPGLQGDLLATMGATYTHLGLYDAADRLLEQAVERTSSTYSRRDPSVATAKQHLADLRRATEDYEAAENLTREALDIRRERLGSNHPAAVESLAKLATIRLDRGFATEAETLFDEARQRAQPHTELLISILFKQALNRRQQGDAYAEELLRDALDHAVTHWGDDHPEVAKILGQLAEAVQHRDPEQAERHLVRAVAIQRAIYPEPHPALASTLNNLAVFRLDRGRLDEAHDGFHEAIDILHETYDDTPTSLEAILLNNLARYHEARGEPDRGIELRHKSLAMHRQTLGEQHKETANARLNLATVLRTQGRLDEAQELLERALDIYLETYGPRHTQVAIIHNNLGLVAQRRGAWEAAEQAFVRASDVLAEIPTAAVELAAVLQNLAALASRDGEYEQAEALYLQALDSLRTAGRDRGAEGAALFNNLSVDRYLEGDYRAAADWAEQALTVYETIQPAGSADRLRSRRIVARAFQELGDHARAEALMRQNVEACQQRWGNGDERCERHRSTLEGLLHPDRN
ncbi:MAG: serine/threonine-protein kinase [Acidobacteriota bacterium]